MHKGILFNEFKNLNFTDLINFIFIFVTHIRACVVHMLQYFLQILPYLFVL